MQGNISRFWATFLVWLGALMLATTAFAASGSSGDDEGGGSGSPGGNNPPTTVVEIKGAVQSMPASGLIGNWTIAGKALVADGSTKFDQEEGALGVGAIVEAKAAPQTDGSLLALKIEVVTGAGGSTGSGTPGSDDNENEGDVTGPIVSLPAGGLIGTWNVGGKSVIVVSTTKIDQEHGAAVVGAIVEVNGMPDSTGAIVANEIEVKNGTPGTVPPPSKVEITGLIEALPAGGLIGNWTVGGRTVIVGATTELDSENGPFVLGASVEAKGDLDTSGALVATKVETTEGNGAAEPPLEFKGTIVTLPAGPGVVGLWKVDDKMVDVTAQTEINSEDGAVAVGAIVEIHGWVQPDGVIEAEEIEVLPAAATPALTKAVEFFNPTLGHFFISTNPAEVAALDAAGKWQRTGQTLNIGAGSNGVCRFYGMPPKGPDSHFFTADPAECQAVMTQFSAWTFEGHVFSATVPVAGNCPAGTIPVHRFFNNPTTAGAINHRFTVTQQAFDQTKAMGWIDEGVVMCAQP
jgi:hypothetical protein